MPLKTPFRLLIGFIKILQVVTVIIYYTVTYSQLTRQSLQFIRSSFRLFSLIVIQTFKVFNSSSHTNFP
jgi:hypothetical protein